MSAVAKTGTVDQEECRRRLADAERLYHQALREYAAAVDLRMGDDSITQAEERKRVARAEYQRRLRTFSDLVVRGKRPKA
jgi:hypothetical protein